VPGSARIRWEVSAVGRVRQHGRRADQPGRDHAVRQRGSADGDFTAPTGGSGADQDDPGRKISLKTAGMA